MFYSVDVQRVVEEGSPTLKEQTVQSVSGLVGLLTCGTGAVSFLFYVFVWFAESVCFECFQQE